MKFLIGQIQVEITLKWLSELVNRFNRVIAITFLGTVLLACQSTQQVQHASEAKSQIISLDGIWTFLPATSLSANYYSEDADFSRASNITVPSNWFRQGFNHHGVAWYKRAFTLENQVQESDIFTLKFQAVDYFADVWLNGHYLGFHEGYFQAFQFDISRHLKSGENILIVRVNSPLEDAGQSWSLHKKYIKGVLGHHDARPGGAWSERGQEQNTGGIWQSVWIEQTQLAQIDEIKFTPKVSASGMTSGEINLKLNVNQTSQAQVTYRLVYQGDTVESYHQNVTLSASQSLLAFELPDATRHLWQPWEHGEPHRYQLAVDIASNGQTLTSKTIDIGFREFTVIEPSGEWLINGKPFFVRGTNYIAWQWLAEFSAQDFARDLKLMKEANINAVRVHAHVLPHEFYHEANKLGMVIWQDFPLQWGYIETDAFLENAKTQAKEMVEQFYNHPSIVLWSAHNEPPWDADWMKYKYADYNSNQNQTLDEAVYQTLKQTDLSRYSHKSSLTAEHPWLGWYSGKWQDYAKPTKQRWITEFGAQALPIKSTLTAIVGKDNLWPQNKKQWAVWEYHNFQKKQTFEIAKVAKGKNIDEFIGNTQGYQANLTAFAAEAYRRQKGQPVNAIFQFMFVENWASMNWGIVDYLRQVKPAYESLKAAYQPLLPSIEYQANKKNFCCDANFSLWLINDYPHEFEHYQLKYQLIKAGDILFDQVLPRDIAASSSEKVTDLKLNGLTSGRYQLRWMVLDDDENIVAENSHFWKVKSHTEKLVASHE